MLFLLLELDGNRYALDVAQVAEVLPYVNLRPVPSAPSAIAGIIDHGGVPVPVVDLSLVLANRAAVRRLSTRIVLVHYGVGDDRQRLLGLVAEHATETIRRHPDEFRQSGVTSAIAPHVERVFLDAAGPLHWIDVNRLLPDSVSTSLFRQAAAS